jgi:hypothetical protein
VYHLHPKQKRTSLIDKNKNAKNFKKIFEKNWQG